jgi:hypothetical protein
VWPFSGTAGNQAVAPAVAAPVVAAPVVAAPAVAAPAVVPALAPVTQPTAEPTTEPVEPVGADTDTLQQGDQTTPDTAAEQAAETAGTETETSAAEEPCDANLPGGGHADDPNDPNADHQFEGVE